MNSEIEAYIKTLSDGKAIFDKMPLKIFKSILPVILESLTHIINISLSTGIVPSFCKYAQVTPILKGGDINDANNYSTGQFPFYQLLQSALNIL